MPEVGRRDPTHICDPALLCLLILSLCFEAGRATLYTAVLRLS